MDTAALISALTAAIDSEAPTTVKEVTGLIDALREHRDELSEWASTLDSLISELDQAGDDLVAAEKDERDDAHGGWTAVAAEVKDHLAVFQPAPAAA
jgi:hypothetical protein